ncbi:hypothetical protein GN244_ATG09252 [Phytophthora infestans]|uniref:Uncharacterized protein n=1 Tax=Phytophthora infestans TaxID=4787 RepID=A0A833WE25_PHYIN|nr:hypothetical protein GN244_ATG09252 [Phytophthora infestans]
MFTVPVATPNATNSEMMEVDEDARDNMEVDEEPHNEMPTIREQLPVESRPQLPYRSRSSSDSGTNVS